MRTFARRATPFLASVSIAVLAALYGLAGLRYHGVTSDSPSLFYAGDRTLYWLTHRDVPRALDFLGPEPPGFHSAFRRMPSSRIRCTIPYSLVWPRR